MSELHQATIDQILFFLFVRLVDQDQAIGLRDVERLDRLLAKPKLLEASFLESSIGDLGKNYQKYWRLYQEKKLAKSNAELEQLLTSLYQFQGQLAWSELQQGLQAFIRFFSTSQGLAAKLRTQKIQHQHRLAIAANLSELLNSWQPETDGGSNMETYAASSVELIEQYQAQMHRLMTAGERGDQQIAIGQFQDAHDMMPKLSINYLQQKDRCLDRPREILQRRDCHNTKLIGERNCFHLESNGFSFRI
jgi:hypothetical protein